MEANADRSAMLEASEALILELESTLARMDDLGLRLAANHVSRAIDTIKDSLDSVQNGGTAPSAAEASSIAEG